VIPPPPVHHKLEGCISRFAVQIGRAQRYVNAILPALSGGDDDENVQFFFQTVVLMLHAFLEEYFRGIVSLGTLWCADEVRAYMAATYPTEAAGFETMEGLKLGSTVAKREVSFRQHAKKLRGILGVITTAPPFADAVADANCHDLIAVRNIITHQGGLTDESDAATVKSPHVVIAREPVGQAVFYRMRIGRAFLVDVLHSLKASLQNMEAAMLADPRYRI
jgi:hypothetical protein